jgi:flavin reductase (DIM6/NTAB) family NADH-FMN oxidoreductase RutF
MADSRDFREAWGKFATGVAVVTSIEPGGGVHGMAANGINSVSLDPMLVLVCVGHNRNSYPLIESTKRFCINILCHDQKGIAEYYAIPNEMRVGETPARFRFTPDGSAVIESSLAAMDCKVVDEVKAGDHTIFIGEVTEIEVNEGEPLLYYQGKFGHLGLNSG